MVGVVVTPLGGEAGGVARGLVGNIGVETDQILPNVALNTAAAQLGPVNHSAVGVEGLAVRAFVQGVAGGEEDAGVREGEAVSTEDGHEGAVESVL